MHVFLSYDSADKDFAEQLASQLTKRGCEVWDPSDRLFPGDNWFLKIGQALRVSKGMVVLLSPDSMKSEWIHREIQYALGNRNYQGRVFPVLVRPTDEIPWILRKFGILRANKDLNEISKRIANALKQVA
jgi:TIR domain-containing protein